LKSQEFREDSVSSDKSRRISREAVSFVAAFAAIARHEPIYQVAFKRQRNAVSHGRDASPTLRTVHSLTSFRRNASDRPEALWPYSGHLALGNRCVQCAGYCYVPLV